MFALDESDDEMKSKIKVIEKLGLCSSMYDLAPPIDCLRKLKASITSKTICRSSVEFGFVFIIMFMLFIG